VIGTIAHIGRGFGPLTSGGTAPDAPTLLVADAGDGAVTATVTGTGTIRLYYRLSGGSVWTAGNSRSGSGTISQTGLVEGAEYEFYASATSDGLTSRPSNIVSVEMSDDTLSFDDWVEANDLTIEQLAAVALLDSMGSDVIYVPLSGASRTIKAVVAYDGVKRIDSMQRGHTSKLTVSVFNHAVYGVTMSQVDTGGDKFTIRTEVGGALQDRPIKDVISQDDGMITFEVR
jgi:hypothetical protein